MASLPKPPPGATFEQELHARLRRTLAEHGRDVQFLSDSVFPSSLPPPTVSTAAKAPATRAVRRAEASRDRPPTIPPPAALTPKQRRQARAERLAKARKVGADYAARVQRTLLAEGVPFDAVKDFALIPRAVWVMVAALLADSSGRLLRIHLKEMRNKVLAGAIRRAALCELPDGSRRYAWSDERARHIGALMLALGRLGKPTRRRGRWEYLVKGIPQGALCALLRNPWTGERPSRAALAGVHRSGAQWQSGEVGWLRALEGAGALYCQQLPAHEAEPCELIGPSGYATNRIWIVTDAPTRPLEDAEKWELIRLHNAGLDLQRGVRAMRPPSPEVLAELAAVTGPPA